MATKRTRTGLPRKRTARRTPALYTREFHDQVTAGYRRFFAKRGIDVESPAFLRIN